jgi:hypothetical protein
MYDKSNIELEKFKESEGILQKIDKVIVIILKKIEELLNQMNSLITNIFKFMKNSLEVKKLKRVFFILIMAIAMAFVFVGVNVIFGKVIL